LPFVPTLFHMRRMRQFKQDSLVTLALAILEKLAATALKAPIARPP
jgi:hypothetical protein